MGARPEPVPQVVQAPASSVLALLGDVDHIVQAIKSKPWERQLQEAQGKQVAAEPLDTLCDELSALSTLEVWRSESSESCLCGMPCHSSERNKFGGSEMDVKLQAASCKCACRLLFLLSDLYFRLGRAYIEDGQFNRALKAVEFARSTRNSSTRNYFLGYSRLGSTCTTFRNRDPKAAEFAWRMRRLPPPKEAFLPKGALFYYEAWILAGDAYVEAQRTFDDSHVVIPHQEPGEELTMSQEVENEVERVVTSCRCFKKESREPDIPLPRIVENDWEQNLTAAEELYHDGLDLCDRYALDCEESEYTVEVEHGCTNHVAFRKMGFVCHEYGRRLAELGWHEKDDTNEYFRKAIRAFHRGKDLPNFELALCSRIEYHRKLAEFRETHQGPRKVRTKAMEEAREEYQAALDLCSDAKNRLKRWGDGLHCKEVDTEEALTYLKLAMFFMSEGKQAKMAKEAKKAIHKAWNLFNNLLDCVTHSQYQLDCIQRERMLFECVTSDVTVDTEEADTYLKLGIMLMREDKSYYDNQEEPNRKGRISAEEAIRKARNLYEKFKESCKQRVAYSQYRLGCVLRDRLLFEKSELIRQLEEELTTIWERASKYYLAVGDTDMFMRIRMEHAEMYWAMLRRAQTNEGLDEVLKILLEVCRLDILNGSSVSEEFIRKLLELLMTMRKAAKSQHSIASSSSPSRANDYKFMERMYRCALELKLKGVNNYRPLYDMWKNPVKS